MPIVQFIIALLTVVGVLAYAYLGAPPDRRLYDGYCPALDRAMTENEKILAALEQSNKSHKINSKDKKTGKGIESRKIIRYSSGQEIYDKFPNCCSVKYYERTDGKTPGKTMSHGYSTEPIRKDGRYAGHVILQYEAPYKTKDDTVKTARISQSMMITNCGKYWNEI